LAAENHANPACATLTGNCDPPSAWSIVMPSRSAAANASMACLTSGITVTVVPSNDGSFWSLFLLCGAK
jgi:hypothetical protein